MPLLVTKLIESKAAQAYPEELRAQAVKLATTYAWFDPLAYLWLFGSILVPIAIPWMLGPDLRAGVFDAVKFVPVFLTCTLIIPIFVGRRALVIRKDKILRVLQGGYNGPDKGREIPSQK
jgi:hypothetical protein